MPVNPTGTFGVIQGREFTPSYTFAALPTTYAVGQPVWVSNIGRETMGASPVAATGSLWTFNGTVWEPSGGSVMLSKLDVAVTGLTNVEVVSGRIQLPAAFLRGYDRIRLRIGLTKSGTTDSGGLRFRIGTAGTTADTVIVAATVLSAAQLQGGYEFDIKILSSTSCVITSRNDLGIGGSTTNPVPSPVTIANISNALYLDVGAVSSSTNNTVGISDAQIWLVR